MTDETKNPRMLLQTIARIAVELGEIVKIDPEAVPRGEADELGKEITDTINLLQTSTPQNVEEAVALVWGLSFCLAAAQFLRERDGHPILYQDRAAAMITGNLLSYLCQAGGLGNPDLGVNILAISRCFSYPIDDEIETDSTLGKPSLAPVIN